MRRYFNLSLARTTQTASLKLMTQRTLFGVKFALVPIFMYMIKSIVQIVII